MLWGGHKLRAQSPGRSSGYPGLNPARILRFLSDACLSTCVLLCMSPQWVPDQGHQSPREESVKAGPKMGQMSVGLQDCSQVSLL